MPRGQFQSTLPIREETPLRLCYPATRGNFNPLFPYGKRPPTSIRRPPSNYFNPLFPYGKRLGDVRPVGAVQISIHSSHTGRDYRKHWRGQYWQISIHSSHTGRDPPAERRKTPKKYFNPLFPYGKRRGRTGPARGRRNFNPLFPYGKRPSVAATASRTDLFQSTLPIREETWWNRPPPTGRRISIHSSHTGRDRQGQRGQKGAHHFNPLFPYGKRRGEAMTVIDLSRFQSTLPIREETRPYDRQAGLRRFQSTLPIREET